MIGYWFSRGDGTTENLSDPAEVGKTHVHDGECVPCRSGLHASPTPWDALQYGRDGTVLWEVEIPDDAIPHGDPVDKHCGKSRKYLKCVDLEREMRLFACDEAERVLQLFEGRHPDDERPREAIEVARRYADGKATREELAAARSAAWSAAWSAADAARSAAAYTAFAAAGAAGERFNELALRALGE